MNKALGLAAALLGAAVLSGCASRATPQEPVGSTATERGALRLGGGTSLVTEPAAEPTTHAGAAAAVGSAQPEVAAFEAIDCIVYFDYDSAQVRNDQRRALDHCAGYLAQNPGATLTLAGHADERGSDEYNRRLGEQRARAVQQELAARGVDRARLHTVSYGEERPAAQGHDESAWSRSRRVEFSKGEEGAAGDQP